MVFKSVTSNTFIRWSAAQACILLTSLTLLAPDVLAQKPVRQSQLSPSSQAYLAQSDPTTEFNLVHVQGGLIDADLNIRRAGFGLSPNMSALESPEATARDWVDRFGRAYGIKSSENLQVIRETGAHGVSHVTFQQMYGNIPVYERFVHVNLGLDGLPTMVSSGFAPHVEDLAVASSLPSVSESQARTAAGAAVTADAFEIHSASLQLYPESVPRMIWKVDVSPSKGIGSWRVLLDAETGALIRILDRLRYRGMDRGPMSATTAPPDSITGRGLIWDPDPLTTSGKNYRGPYFIDNSDASNDSLAAQLIEVELPDITLGPDTLYRLEGPYVKIMDTPDRYTPPAIAHPDSFLYHRDDDHFESVMAYYHIHSSQLYVQSLDIGRPVAADTIIVKSHVFSDDNSYWSVDENELGFGSGGVDDAEDVEVILHEYGHTLLDYGTATEIGGIDEGGAYHEGFADYWAVSHTRNIIESGDVPHRDWRQIFDWDAGMVSPDEGRFWPGRYIDPSLTYDDATCSDAAFGLGCNIYYDGLILANALMDIWTEIGKDVTDRILLFSHGYLARPFTMESGIQALVQADIDLNEGANVATINRHFRDSAYPTSIYREPEIPELLSFQPNYPNPFVGTTNITYHVDRTTNVRVEVFNVLGQRVMLFRDGVETAGTHTHTLDLSGHPAGMYVLRVTTTNRQQSQPLLLVR